MKDLYIDLMEQVLDAYTTEDIREYTLRVKRDGLCEHGFPRLTANLGILIAHGKKTYLKSDFLNMMDLCCEEIPFAHQKKGDSVGNDFSVKEIILCLLETERAGIFEKNITDRWRSNLGKIDPQTTYSVIADVPPKRIGNWAAYGAASEQLRKFAQIGDESDFIENQIASQIFSFDENGMYRDPNEPMVYDLVTRLQLAVACYFGYNGKSRKILENTLIKSADITLKMQSVTGEIPYGGRSNQFLHNEAFYAALCEFYAYTFKKMGNIDKAKSFKRAAKVAIQSIIPWLEHTPIHHVKNFYDIRSKYGCESYAYFDKYMVTTGSWLYLAYCMCDNKIDEGACPAESENFICETSDFFHKIFCKYSDYYIEIDTAADPHYDASGIGRIQKKGMPVAICLSVPFAEFPVYMIDCTNPSPFSICGGINTGNGYMYAYNNTKYKLLDKTISDTFLQLKLKCTLNDGTFFLQTCTISDSGISIIVDGKGELEILFPVFNFDGEKHTEISVSPQIVEVNYIGCKCKYSTENKIISKNSEYANRNGHYKAFAVNGKNRITLSIKIE